MNALNAKLEQFIGTEKYWSLKPLSHLVLTDGAKYLNDISAVVQDQAIAITFTPKLKQESFLSLTIEVKGNKTIATIDDGDYNVLWTQQYASKQGLEEGSYGLYITGGVMMLASEY